MMCMPSFGVLVNEAKNSSGLPAGDFSLTQMFEVLRDKESGISRGTDHPHPTAGSMVSGDACLYPLTPCACLLVSLTFPLHLRNASLLA